MPITFGELVQEVINEVRARETAFNELKVAIDLNKELEAKVKELEAKLIVREPDKPKLTVLPPKEEK